jgi:hypothetical protein
VIARVAESEHALIALARGLIVPPPRGVAMLGERRVLPPSIGPTCASLLEDALRHMWPALLRRGGARALGHRGRLWERHPPVALVFTSATLDILRWLVATPQDAARTTPLSGEALAIGDQIVSYLALAAAEGAATRAAIAAQPLVRSAPLAWLGFAHLMRGAPPSFETLVEDQGAIVVEALAGELAAHWRAVELGKRAIMDPDTLIALGAAQDAVLTAFMAACDRRRVLTGFVIDAAAPVLSRGRSPLPVDLDPNATLAQRSAARVAAGALLRGVLRWQSWDDQHRAIRFIDDGYAEAQDLLAWFERIGRAGADRAAGWLAELATLAPVTAPTLDTIEPP